MAHPLRERLFFPLGSGTKRTNTLINMVQKDDFFAPLLTATETGKLLIKHHYSYIAARYIPSTEENTPPTIFLSRRYSMAINAHLLLHELVHYRQDEDGQLVTPHSLQEGEHRHLPPQEIVSRYMACEAEAAIQAIAASWRLATMAREETAWQGALRSKPWRKLTQRYQQMRRSGLTEEQAVEKLTQHWYGDPQARFYRKQAEKLATLIEN